MSTLAVNRQRAIAQSGWGEDFRLVQPHNLAFWVYCLLVVVGAYVLWGQVSIAAAAYSGALTSGIVAFGLLAVAYALFIHREDRYTTVPPKLAAAGFVWGFVPAIGAFAIFANEAVIDLYAKAFGASFAYDWGAALAAPVNEELAKGAGVLLLLTLAPKLVRSPFDGLILGAFVGLGFQISEDISYAWIGAANAFGDVDAAWATILIRTLSSIPSHWMFTAIFGAGLVWFIGRPDVPSRKGVGVGLMLTAVLMHGLWNASGAIANNSVFDWIVPLAVTATLISTFVWIYKNTQPIERKWMRELMAPEVASGVVTPAEL
ncbi:MAG TPA: PrsW family intramembrane metalloprotease, partial [Conexibacter sp.]|nr:PrsW family intramembrane metalloprotease [Conexibacter sp.]